MMATSSDAKTTQIQEMGIVAMNQQGAFYIIGVTVTTKMVVVLEILAVLMMVRSGRPAKLIAR